MSRFKKNEKKKKNSMEMWRLKNLKIFFDYDLPDEGCCELNTK